MDQTLTLILMAVTTLVAAFALYKARKPLELGRSWHVPWNGILFLGLLAFLLLLRHQLSLSGIDLPAR
ncbi:hypothetical protein [Paremcibacter congregatus]|uniref:hypothetical protein n=1 Tax=Paremcibacter congregatus TaxID=2043170 RepID=UPI003A8F6A65|tara:strand:+ start:1261 stop:1464 length:204 start_codon:yes stop_codon:yes gene_type:complete